MTRNSIETQLCTVFPWCASSTQNAIAIAFTIANFVDARFAVCNNTVSWLARQPHRIGTHFSSGIWRVKVEIPLTILWTLSIDASIGCVMMNNRHAIDGKSMTVETIFVDDSITFDDKMKRPLLCSLYLSFSLALSISATNLVSDYYRHSEPSWAIHCSLGGFAVLSGFHFIEFSLDCNEISSIE